MTSGGQVSGKGKIHQPVVHTRKKKKMQGQQQGVDRSMEQERHCSQVGSSKRSREGGVSVAQAVGQSTYRA